MVKIIFLCVVLFNIVFFFWQYRQGAPEIPLSQRYEKNIGSASHAQKIRLPSEISGVEQLGGGVNLKSDIRAQ